MLDVPVGGVAAFAFAVMNYGVAPGRAYVSASGVAGAPVVLVCFTNPTTGQCIDNDGVSSSYPGPPSLSQMLLLGQVATGTVYVQATSAVSFDPVTTRVTVSFAQPVFDPFDLGPPRPATPYVTISVAVRAQ